MKTDFPLISSQKRVIKREERVGLVIPFQVRIFTTLATVKQRFFPDILMYTQEKITDTQFGYFRVFKKSQIWESE